MMDMNRKKERFRAWYLMQKGITEDNILSSAGDSNSKVKSIKSLMLAKAEIELKKEAADEFIKRRNPGNNSKSIDDLKNNYVKAQVASVEKQSPRTHAATPDLYAKAFNDAYKDFINRYVKGHMPEKEAEIELKVKQLKEDIDLSGPLIDLRKVEEKIERNLIEFPAREEELKGLFGGRRKYRRSTRKNDK